MPKPIKITTLDNTTIQANFFNAPGFSNKVVLIVSGVGIQSKFYASFAEAYLQMATQHILSIIEE